MFGNALGNYVVDSMGPKASALEPAQQQAQNDDPFDIGANFKRGLGEKIDQYYDDQYQQRLSFDIEEARLDRMISAGEIGSIFDYAGPIIASNDLSPQQQAYVDGVRDLMSNAKDTVSEIGSKYAPVAENIIKVVSGGLTVGTGGVISMVPGGVWAGAPLVTIGGSQIIEGGSGLYDFYKGGDGAGNNPLRSLFNAASPKWGDTAYDSVALAANVGSMWAQTPLKVGLADGMNRPNSIFGVTVSRFNNKTLTPITKIPMPYGTTQVIMATSAAAGTGRVVSDVNEARKK